MDKRKEIKIDQSLTEEVLINQRGKFVHPTTEYTVMLIPNSTDKVKLFILPFDKIMRAIVMLCAILLIVISLLASAGIRNYRREHDATDNIRIKQLEDTLVALSAREKALTDVNEKLQEELNVRTDAEEKRSAEQKKARIPDAPAVEGVAILIRNTDSTNSFRNVYNAMSGTLILATGGGVLKEIDADPVFGYRFSLDHGNGYVTRYYSPVEPRIAEGSEVGKTFVLAVIAEDNQMVAYELMKDSKYVNPAEVAE